MQRINLASNDFNGSSFLARFGRFSTLMHLGFTWSVWELSSTICPAWLQFSGSKFNQVTEASPLRNIHPFCFSCFLAKSVFFNIIKSLFVWITWEISWPWHSSSKTRGSQLMGKLWPLWKLPMIHWEQFPYGVRFIIHKFQWSASSFNFQSKIFKDFGSQIFRILRSRNWIAFLWI